jgi:hypothetical protein
MEPEPMTTSVGTETAQSPGTVEQTSAQANHRSGCRQGKAAPLTVRVELVLDGEAGKELARRQDAAVRAVLEWVRDNSVDHPGCDGSASS